MIRHTVIFTLRHAHGSLQEKMFLRDAKTALQELAARRRRPVRYELVSADGPPQARTFTSRVLVDGDEMGVGSGHSKQASEQAAARVALESMSGDATGIAPC